MNTDVLSEPSLNQKRFDELAAKWKDETGGLSSLPAITANRHYLRIIGYGMDAVPFILRDLRRQPAPWFAALRLITGRQNIGRQTPGDFAKMAEAWIGWGKEQGLV